MFSILRNARALHVGEAPNMIVCWGGHSINENEYLYARRVGTQLGLRELNICTGCGPGAMEAPMKGAAVGHAQQRYKDSRFIGMTEPSIIAAEPPNPLVNELIIMRISKSVWKPSYVSPTGSLFSRAASALPKSCSTCWVF